MRILARWKKGHVYHGGGGDGEMYLNLGEVSSKEQAKGLAKMVAEGQPGQTVSVTKQGPLFLGGALPVIGGTLGGEYIQSYTAAVQDVKGAPVTVITPTLVDPQTRRREDVLRRAERASVGVKSLWGSPFRDAQGGGSSDGTEPSPFDIKGLLTDLFEPDEDDVEPSKDSNIWQTKSGWRGAWIDLTLTKSAGTSATRVDVLHAQVGYASVDFEFLCSCYIGAGKRKGMARIPGPGIPAGDGIMLRLVNAGIDAEDLVATLYGAAV